MLPTAEWFTGTMSRHSHVSHYGSRPGFSVPSGAMRVLSAVSGEAIANLNADETEGKSVKSLKAHLAEEIGVSRFRQRWFSEDHVVLPDESIISHSTVQLVILDLGPRSQEQGLKLITACDENCCDEVEALLQLPLCPDAANEAGRTALHAAALAGHGECLGLLLEAGAAKNQEDGSGQTALHLAAE